MPKAPADLVIPATVMKLFVDGACRQESIPWSPTAPLSFSAIGYTPTPDSRWVAKCTRVLIWSGFMYDAYAMNMLCLYVR